MNDFLTFGSKLISTTVQAHPDDSKFDHKLLIKGNYTGIDFPVIFKQEYGKKYTDILDTGYAGLYLISDKLKGILEENNLTGWKVFPIKLFDKKNNEISGYHGFSVIGRCGSTSFENSEIF